MNEVKTASTVLDWHTVPPRGAHGKIIALVVPSIVNTGGVAAVAEFIMRTILDHSDYGLRIVSLAMGAADQTSVRLTAPNTWIRGIRTEQVAFRGQTATHVGALFSEIETQRYKPRPMLNRVLEGVDLVQVVCGTPSWAGPVVDLDIPVCLQVATLIGVERPPRLASNEGVERAFRQWMTQRVTSMETPVLRKCTLVQVENSWMHAHVSEVTDGFGVEVVTAHPGVDDKLFHPASSRPAAPGYILSVGRMSDPRKNHMLLLETYRRLCERLPDAPRLALAGPDQPSGAFRRRAEALSLWDRVEIHQGLSKPDLAKLYRQARAFLLTSDEEGFGVTVVEAMASGTPPIVTRSGGPDDIITTGEDGFLASCGDAEALAGHLHHLLVDPALETEMSRNARETVLARYGARAAGRKFLDIYDRLLCVERD